MEEQLECGVIYVAADADVGVNAVDAGNIVGDLLLLLLLLLQMIKANSRMKTKVQFIRAIEHTDLLSAPQKISLRLIKGDGL